MTEHNSGIGHQHGHGHGHDEQVPSNPYWAADWLAARHPWLWELAERIAGPLDGPLAPGDWLDELAQAVNDDAEHTAAWTEYERRHPASTGYSQTAELAYDRWYDAGPKPTERGHAFGVMSSGEKNLIRLVATLSRIVRVPWSVSDVSFDRRGAAVLSDWLAVVRRQLPDWVYPGREGDR